MTTRILLLAVGLAATAAGGTAQDAPANKVYAFFSPQPSLDADKKVFATGTERAVSLGLRPNVEQHAYVFAYNPTEDDKTVNVILSAGTKVGDEIARTAAPVVVPAKQVVKVALVAKPAATAVPPVPPAAADKDKPAPPPEPQGVKVKNESTLVLRVEEAGKPEKPRAAEKYEKYDVIVNPPRSPYFKATYQRRAKEGTLAVTVEFVKPTTEPLFSDKPAKVRLDLRPDLNPDLDPETLKQGTFEAEVTVGNTATLFAEGVKYRPGRDKKKAVVAVSVDGYDRAFLIQTNFDGNPDDFTAPFANVKLSSERQVPGKPVTVTVETDRITAPTTVLSVDRTGNDTFDVIQRYDTERNAVVYVKVGGDNDAVKLTPVVQDWAVEFATTAVAGKRTFKVQRGPTKDGEDSAVLLVDRTAPEDVKLADLPAKDKILVGTEHTLKASGLDPESDVAAVYFYVGDAPAADGKPAPGGKAVKGVLLDKATNTWATKDPLRLPDVRGEIKVGALFVNGVGLTSPTEAVVYVREPEKEGNGKPKKTTGSIVGTVVQATRLQPDLPVALFDSAKKELKKTKTDSAGKFEFKDLPPGEYIVASVKRQDQNANGQADVTVEAGDKPAKAEIAIKR
jgi:hypothetical protein